MIELNPTKLPINRERVLLAAGCAKDSPVYNTVCGEYEKYKGQIELEPRILINFGGADPESVYIMITVGEKVSDYSKKLMDNGDCLAGLLVNAYADEAVFELDKIAAQYIKKECALRGEGISERIELSPNMQQKAVDEIKDTFKDTGISINSALMLDPPKSMAYVLRLAKDKNIFKAQHDCSSCPLVDCPRRSTARGEFDIISGYDGYNGKNTGKSVICIDIGTTTLAFSMIKKNGQDVEYTAMNMQRRFGADVISRIEAANRGRGSELREIIIFQIINGVKTLIEKCAEEPEIIVISGNTVMTHLLMGYPCNSLGEYPFKPYSADTVVTSFDKLTNNKMLDIPVTVIGGISAFVGGDIVSGLYMCDFDLSDNINLFIDLGTNGEMAVGGKDKIFVTSTAAGPAFEGGKISCGTGSIDGAICSVDIKSKTIKTINDKEACGICGTGIIETVAGLWENGLIDETGLLNKKYFDKGYPVTDNIMFTQQDIREIQTAKSAIRSGIEMLIKKIGKNYNQIEKVYLAGGFGYRLTPEKACSIGLIPKELLGKIEAVGNSSLGGAVKYAYSADGEKRVKNIQSISEEFSLAQDEYFNELYLKYMYF